MWYVMAFLMTLGTAWAEGTIPVVDAWHFIGTTGTVCGYAVQRNATLPDLLMGGTAHDAEVEVIFPISTDPKQVASYSGHKVCVTGRIEAPQVFELQVRALIFPSHVDIQH